MFKKLKDGAILNTPADRHTHTDVRHETEGVIFSGDGRGYYHSKLRLDFQAFTDLQNCEFPSHNQSL